MSTPGVHQVSPSSTAPPSAAVSWEPLRLTHQKPSFTNQEMALASRNDLWHKFIIFDAGFHSKEDVMMAVIAACAPEILLPVMYKLDKNSKATFFSKCTPNAIENLVKNGLRASLPNGAGLVRMDIILGFCGMKELPLNPTREVTQALYSRYSFLKRGLNLDEFHKEPRLGSIYCPLSMPRVFLFVLRCTKTGPFVNARETKLPVRELSLKHNDIKAIVPFEKFFNYHLSKLDLRNNQIDDLNYLRYFSEFKITELWLDKNPVCNKYNTPDSYINAVKSIFPFLQQLDGVTIDVEQKATLPITKSFLADNTRTDLVKQFIQHFFALFDQDDRMLMDGLYDKEAFFSMTLGNNLIYVHKQITSTFAHNRNLLKCVDYARCHDYLLQGPEKIIPALRRQPTTIHNVKNMKVDILHQGDYHLALSVQGAFVYKKLMQAPLFFSRTFILAAKEDNEYCIINDQYHIDSIINSSTADLKLENKGFVKFTPTVLSVCEKEQLVGFLQELTKMKADVCIQFLDGARWNIYTAISNFMKKYTGNNVPPSAFSQV